MKNNRINTVVLFFMAAAVVCLTGQTLLGIEIPTFKNRVNDYAGILSADQEANLESLLIDTENKTSSQVVLMTLRSLEGENLEDFAIRTAEKNKVGQKEFDNGVLMLVVSGDRKIRIEAGYGLESIITDLKSGYIIREIIIPYFKKNDYYGGINRGLAAITGLISKEFDITPEQLARYEKKGGRKKGGHFPFAVIVFIIIVLVNMFRGGRGGRGRGGGVYFGGGGFGGGSSGGFGGGGFSGGGGSFGGGGASGSW